MASYLGGGGSTSGSTALLVRALTGRTPPNPLSAARLPGVKPGNTSAQLWPRIFQPIQATKGQQ